MLFIIVLSVFHAEKALNKKNRAKYRARSKFKIMNGRENIAFECLIISL
jgi:hypothetical protein